jgi:hypothetical protein
MSDEVAGWQAKLPERAGHGIAQAFRQVLDAAVRWERMTRNPGKLAGPNRRPAPRGVRPFARHELEAIAVELSPMYQPIPAFAAATGLRPGVGGVGAPRHRPCGQDDQRPARSRRAR